MFTNIKLSEVSIFAKNMSVDSYDEDGNFYAAKSPEEILETIELIDNMLSVMKSRSLMNKKRNVKKMLDGLISMSIGDTSVVPGHSNNHLLS